MTYEEKLDAIIKALEQSMETIKALAEENEKLMEQLDSCAQRNRYDGDLFHDQGLENRMEASWKEYYAAQDLLRQCGYFDSPANHLNQ